jgi:hypothetical protein
MRLSDHEVVQTRDGAWRVKSHGHTGGKGYRSRETAERAARKAEAADALRQREWQKRQQAEQAAAEQRRWRQKRNGGIALGVFHVLSWIAVLTVVLVADDIGQWLWRELSIHFNGREPLGSSADWEDVAQAVLGLTALIAYVWAAVQFTREMGTDEGAAQLYLMGARGPAAAVPAPPPSPVPRWPEGPPKRRRSGDLSATSISDSG